jgi:hypothetical protein
MMASKNEEDKQLANELWYWYLTGEHKHGFPKSYVRMKNIGRLVYSILPGDTRCFECNLPLNGTGAAIMGPLGLKGSRFSPELCACVRVLFARMRAGQRSRLPCFSPMYADRLAWRRPRG